MFNSILVSKKYVGFSEGRGVLKAALVQSVWRYIMFRVLLQVYSSHRELSADLKTITLTLQNTHIHYIFTLEPHTDSSYPAARKDRVIPALVFPLSLLSELLSLCGPLSTATATSSNMVVGA